MSNDVTVRVDRETRDRLRLRAAQWSAERGEYVSMGQAVRDMLNTLEGENDSE